MSALLLGFPDPSLEMRASRLLPFLPLLFFMAHLVYHYRQGTQGHILWMCHVSNVVLSAGMLLKAPLLIRIAFLWLIPGLPLWVWEMVRTADYSVTTFLSHFGGIAVGLYAVSRVGAGRSTWLYAMAWYLIMQQMCRWITAPALNVNLAHSMRDGWETTFHAYWQYWLFTTSIAAIALWVINLLLLKVFPPPVNQRP